MWMAILKAFPESKFSERGGTPIIFLYTPHTSLNKHLKEKPITTQKISLYWTPLPPIGIPPHWDKFNLNDCKGNTLDIP